MTSKRVLEHRPRKELAVRFSPWLILAGLALAALIFVVTGGRVVFLPLLLIIPFGLFRLGRRN